MVKLQRHQQDDTYYLQPYVGGMVTWQIHPDGLAWLKREGVRVGAELPEGALSEFRERNWLYTKDQIPTWGEVDWAPDWDKIGPPTVNPYKAAALKGREERKRLRLEAERAEEQRQRADALAASAEQRRVANERRRERYAEKKAAAEAERLRIETAMAERRGEQESADRRAEANRRRREAYAQRKAANDDALTPQDEPTPLPATSTRQIHIPLRWADRCRPP